MDSNGYELGIVGLGVIGRNLLLNMADHGFRVAGYDRDPAKVDELRQQAAGFDVQGAGSMEELVGLLGDARTVMILVPAGPPVDAVIRELMPFLRRGDLLIDGGNSYFKDTELRASMLAEHGIQYLGIGISGGEEGARHGPSIMAGGPQEAYDRVRPILEAIAAKAPNKGPVLRRGKSPELRSSEPCVALLGPGGAGHFVKMVHNGIEYAVMQLIAETYDVMARGLHLDDEELHTIYEGWNQGELASFLLEITAQIFAHIDERSGRHLIDLVLDEAAQKGTGKWTSQNAMDLGVPVPTIDAAVAMRALSTAKQEREAAAALLRGPEQRYHGPQEHFLGQLRNALFASMIVAYAQGMALLRAASQAHAYNLDLAEVASIWREGCIIRAAVLEHIRTIFSARPGLPNLLMDRLLGWQVMARQADWRAVVREAASLGIPIPAMMASLAYYDGYRSAWLPANLIQAQRDYFGAHTYERIDAQGTFHTEWQSD